jgi:hypothetical protein
MRSIALISATSNELADSTRMATNGSAMRVMRLPKIDTVAAVHTRRKAGFARSEREGGGSVSPSAWSATGSKAMSGQGRAGPRSRLPR